MANQITIKKVVFFYFQFNSKIKFHFGNEKFNAIINSLTDKMFAVLKIDYLNSR